jgi:hypothetical protein
MLAVRFVPSLDCFHRTAGKKKKRIKRLQEQIPIKWLRQTDDISSMQIFPDQIRIKKNCR